jgi:hypothetical protein
MAGNVKEKETKAVAPRRPFMDVSRWERDMERMMEDFLAEEQGHGDRIDGLEPKRWR